MQAHFGERAPNRGAADVPSEGPKRQGKREAFCTSLMIAGHSAAFFKRSTMLAGMVGGLISGFSGSPT
eukprot:3044707-Alexandrium_andersonii.AAC.1